MERLNWCWWGDKDGQRCPAPKRDMCNPDYCYFEHASISKTAPMRAVFEKNEVSPTPADTLGP